MAHSRSQLPDDSLNRIQENRPGGNVILNGIGYGNIQPFCLDDSTLAKGSQVSVPTLFTPLTAMQSKSKDMQRRIRPWENPEPTGLEPATSAVTGRRSNQLSYGSFSDRRGHPASEECIHTGGPGSFQQLFARFPSPFTLAVHRRPAIPTRPQTGGRTEADRHKERHDGTEHHPPRKFHDRQPARLRIGFLVEENLPHLLRQSAEHRHGQKSRQHGQQVAGVATPPPGQHPGKENSSSDPYV